MRILAVLFTLAILSLSPVLKPTVAGVGRNLASVHTAQANSKKSRHVVEREAPAEVGPVEKKPGFFQRLFKGGGAKKQKAPKSSQSAGKIEHVTRDADVRVKRFIDVNVLNAKMRGKLKGKGQFIIDTANRHGIDPVFFASVMAMESTWGTSKAIRNYNNPGGMMEGKKGRKHKSFPTIEAGIEAMAANLVRKYLNDNLVTVRTIAKRYCPVGAANDPRRTNAQWPGTVSDIMNRFIKGSVGAQSKANPLAEAQPSRGKKKAS